MSEQAQSSGHEWIEIGILGNGICSCGKFGKRKRYKLISRADWQVHVASAAQAAQPQEVPAEQRKMTRMEAEKVITDEILLRIARRYEKCDMNIYPDMPILTPVEAVLRCAAEEGFKLVQQLPAQPASAAKSAEQRLPTIDELIERWEGYYAAFTSPYYDVSEAPDAMKGLRQCIDELKAIKPHLAQPASAAKPAEDGLEAQVTAWLFTQFGTRFGWTNEGDIESLANFIRAQQAARERELREKLEGLTAQRLAKLFHETYERLAPSFGYETRKESAVAWESVPENNRKLMTAVCSEILASHWTAHPPKTETPGSGE